MWYLVFELWSCERGCLVEFEMLKMLRMGLSEVCRRFIVVELLMIS